MTQSNWKAVFGMAFCAAACSQPGLAQMAPATVLQIDFENRVGYNYDGSDYSKLATAPDIPNPVLTTRTLGTFITLADIVAVNGKPARGTWVERGTYLNLTPSLTPGQAIADTIRTVISERVLEFVQADGTPIGSIMCSGPGGGSPAPGAPLAATASSYAIYGGTGAFLGVRGQVADVVTIVAGRTTVVTEDPANRRVNGGGTRRSVLHVIPMFRPEIVITASGPAVFHSDFSPVTDAKPGRKGEVLIVKATGLGPTVPGVDPGQPFPLDRGTTVNSPLDVTVNGQAADVVNKIGWPGLVDTYRVDFRVPDGATGGTAAIQLSAAWIAGSAMGIPVQ